MNEFVSHSEKQDKVLLSTTPITVAATGIQWGKTTIGAVWLKMMMHTFTGRDDNFIITSPTFPIISQSTLPPFLRLMEGLGTHDKKLNCFRMDGGGTCWFRTGTDPDSIVGIPKVRAILADEAGKYSLYFWENIQGRADPQNAPIMIVTSPYSLNWLYKEIIRPKMKDPNARPDATLVQAASVENPYFNRERYYQREKTMDPRRFKMMYGGGWDRVEGLVYDCFDEVENVCKPFALPTGTEYYAGVDWGFSNPFAITVRAVTPDGYHYQVAEFYRTGLSPSQKVEAAKRLKLTFNIKLFYCDPEEAASIAEFNSAGIPSVAADNSVKRGVELHYELIKSRRFKIFEGTSPYSIDEMETYHWPEPKDLKVDQDEKDPNPVAQNNHACLAAGTMVMTPAGEFPIETIRPGQLVSTPIGPRRVVASGATGVRPTVVAEFSNGTRIEGTADHPYYLRRKGFMSLGSCQFGTFHTWAESGNGTSTLSSTAGAIAGMVAIGLQSAVVRTVASVCTSPFGKLATALCRMASTFITKTTTGITTACRTLSSSLRASMRATTASTCLSPGGPSFGTGWKRFGTSLPNGTHRLMGLLGTGRTERRAWPRDHWSIVRALNVEPPIDPRARAAAFARTIVRAHIEGQAAWMTFKQRASSVLSRSERTDTPGTEHVRMLAVAPSAAAPKPVYNLTVDGAGCFFANGVLVSNCDSMRYITISTVRNLETTDIRRRRQPFVAADASRKLDHHAETERLKRPVRVGSTEEWS